MLDTQIQTVSMDGQAEEKGQALKAWGKRRPEGREGPGGRSAQVALDTPSDFHSRKISTRQDHPCSYLLGQI